MGKLLAWPPTFGRHNLPLWYYDKSYGHGPRFTINLGRSRGFCAERLDDANGRPYLSFIVWSPRRIGQMRGLLRYRYFSLPLRWLARRPPDYEALAARAGWCKHVDSGLMIYHGPTWGSWKAAVSWAGTDQEPDGECDRPTLYTSWKECCENEDLV